MTNKQLPLLFTPSNRAAIRQGIKTHTRRGWRLENVIADEAVWDEINWEWDFYKDGRLIVRHSQRCPYGNPQVEPVEYWVREPVKVLTLHGDSFQPDYTADIAYLDDGPEGLSQVVSISDSDSCRLLDRRDWRKPTTALHMLKSFTRTWLRGVRTWPEKLGDITPEDAINEGIELCPTVAASWDSIKTRVEMRGRPAWRDYLSGGYDLSPVQSYVSQRESIYGPGSWKPEQWVWCVEWEVKP